MGDRYEISLTCPYCGFYDEDVYYAPSCGFLTMKCQKCGNESMIVMGFVAKKATKKEIEKMYKEEGFGRH